MPIAHQEPKLLSWASQLDDNTLAQAKETSQMPFVFPHVALMPDAHLGKGSAVGTVIPTMGAVIPAAVGVDLGCGCVALPTIVRKKDLEGLDLAELRAGIEKAIPVSMGNYNHDLDLFPFTGDHIAELEAQAYFHDHIDLSHSPKWRQQLGTLGGGNHFIELCLDETDMVWLLLHSGSRGVGNKIANKHIKIAQAQCKQWWIDLPNPELAYLVEGTEEFSEYIAEMKWAQQFAYYNRAEMMLRFAEVFGLWIGHDYQEIQLEVFNVPNDEELLPHMINNHHNYTQKENHYGKDVWVTRKGAVDAHEGKRGIIPGSMGTATYIVRGKGDAQGLCSAPHGAGRRFSRTEARKRFTEADLVEAMTGIEYRHGDAWVDEIPGAYKDIDVVMADAADLVAVEHTLHQVMNVKGT